MERGEGLTQAASWCLENLVFSERSQLRRGVSCLILFICKVQDRQIHRDRKCIGSCQRLAGRGRWEGLPGGVGLLFGVIRMFWNWPLGTVAQAREYTELFH